MSTQHTPLPWEAVEATEHHGPYITTAFGTTVCDLYAMTDPNNIFNGRKSVPASFTDADKNVHLIVRAVNSYDDMLAALKELHQLIDFEEPITNDKPMVFKNADAINDAMRNAYAVIAKATQP